jgi:hypothetical protein
MLIGITRDQGLALHQMIIEYLKNILGLALSKSTIAKVRKGVNFCGYRMWRTLIVIRKYSLYKFRRTVKAQKQEAINSLLGHAKQTNSLHYMLKIIKEAIANGKNIQIPENYRQHYNLLPT